uniref:7TM_GPCR_Srx domain-containing protein n=1 Tax=Globodera pallida TaxID=36090 RepID=A0A183CIB1_GLOPA
MINITSNSPPSEAVMLSGSVLSYAELVVHPISLMTSFFSVALIINTSVLHSNLKCILLGQCAGIVMYEIARIVYVVIKFMAGNVFFQGPIAIQMIGLFGYTLRNLVNHVLIAERTMATIKFRTYGQFNWVGFTALWITASIGISGWITFSQKGSPWSVTPMAMISLCVIFGMGLIEITTLIFLQVYNLRKYRSSRTGINLSLNDKYQVNFL